MALALALCLPAAAISAGPVMAANNCESITLDNRHGGVNVPAVEVGGTNVRGIRSLTTNVVNATRVDVWSN